MQDSAIPIPPGSGLQGLRTIAPSPFPDEGGRVWYFGGKDAGGTQPRFHNTAWIYRGELFRPDRVVPGDGALGEQRRS